MDAGLCQVGQLKAETEEGVQLVQHAAKIHTKHIYMSVSVQTQLSQAYFNHHKQV